MTHYLVGWGSNVRYAKAEDEKGACKYAFGLFVPEMAVVEIPKNPKYLSKEEQNKYWRQVVEKAVAKKNNKEDDESSKIGKPKIRGLRPYSNNMPIKDKSVTLVVVTQDEDLNWVFNQTAAIEKKKEIFDSLNNMKEDDYILFTIWTGKESSFCFDLPLGELEKQFSS